MSDITTRRTRPAVAGGLGIAAGLVVSLVVLAFLWPVATSAPHDLPVGTVGTTLTSPADAAVAVTSYDSRADAVRAIEEREVYGAVVVGPDGTEALVAGAGSAAARPILEGIGAQVAAASGTTFTPTDVVPLSDDDPSGAGINAMAFPLVLGGILGGVLVSLLVAGVARRMLALSAYAVIGGVLTAAVTGPLLGIAAGGFWLDALVLGVGMLGTASTVVGLNALIGPAGIGLGAVITMLIANPISGAALPHEFITGPWGDIGQYFVPGAAISLFREANYFPDASSLHEWVVLGCWILAGVALSVTGHLRGTTPVHLPDDELDPVPALAGVGTAN